MDRRWEADSTAKISRRLGKSAAELGFTKDTKSCPDLLELDSGDVAIIGRDMTDAYRDKLPDDASVGSDERIVVIPGAMLRAAKPDIRDV